MDYLASEPVMREFTERTLFIPSNATLRAAGDLKYRSDDPQVQAALAVFNDDVKNLTPEANRLPAWKWSAAYYTALVTRTGQAMAGELSLDEAFARMDSDIAEQVAQAGQ
jgi:alpha-1,4-digalacturonate transport system substrate-binding protein